MISETEHPSPRPFPPCGLQESPRPLWAPRPALRSSHKRASTPPSSPDPSHIGDGPSEGSVPDLRVRNSSDGGPTRAAHHWSHWRDGEQVGNAPVPVPAPPGAPRRKSVCSPKPLRGGGPRAPEGTPSSYRSGTREGRQHTCHAGTPPGTFRPHILISVTRRRPGQQELTSPVHSVSGFCGSQARSLREAADIKIRVHFTDEQRRGPFRVFDGPTVWKPGHGGARPTSQAHRPLVCPDLSPS